MDIKRMCKKALPWCGLYVLVFLVLSVSAVLLQYWDMGLRQCMGVRTFSCDLDTLPAYASQLESDGDVFVATGSDPYFELDTVYGRMVDVVLDDLPQEGVVSEMYYAPAGEGFSAERMEYYTYRNGHNLIRLPEESCDKIRLDVIAAEGAQVQVKSITFGSPWRLHLMAYWKQMALLSLLIVLLWWCI